MPFEGCFTNACNCRVKMVVQATCLDCAANDGCQLGDFPESCTSLPAHSRTSFPSLLDSSEFVVADAPARTCVHAIKQFVYGPVHQQVLLSFGIFQLVPKAARCASVSSQSPGKRARR